MTLSNCLPFGWLFIVLLSVSFCESEDYLYDDTAIDNEQEQWIASQPQWSSAANGPVFQPRPGQNAASDSLLVQVPGLGSVRGLTPYKTIKNRSINAYLGLKYAQLKRGLGRFQQATTTRTSNSQSIVDATQQPKNCAQFPDLEKIQRDEAIGIDVDDCLTLNIHVPAQAKSLPVLVFVHGEMLFDGSAEEGQPDYFLEHEVVLVSINYRLAPFGFLTTLSNEMPGNVALSDIHLALEWVHRNIRYFGGNPDQITLFGQAGGASLVHALSISGKASGLFHKLILQSGTALNPYFIDENPLNIAKSIASTARCPISSGARAQADLHDCFERLSTSELLNAFKQHFEQNERRGIHYTGGFKLVVGDRLGYLPQHPAALVAQNTVPIIAGVTKDAGAFLMSRFYDQIRDLRSRNISDFINVVLTHTTPVRQHQLWRKWALEQIFTPEDARAPNARSLSQGLLELVNLILYRSPVIDSIRYTSKSYPTYLYYFDYRGEYHRFGHLENPLPFGIDATLSDDNIYLFPYPSEVSRLNPEDKTISRALITMWVNFAEFGIPNPNAGVWPKVSTEYGPFLRFTNSQEKPLEIDIHFAEGIPVPNQYPQYFTTTTTSTTTTTTTTTSTERPYDNQNYPFNQYNRPQYANYRNVPRQHTYDPYQQQRQFNSNNARYDNLARSQRN